MQGNDGIISHLNRLLGDELIAVNQYFLHAQVFKSLGVERLNNIEYKEYMDELKHADLYATRILFLEGSLTVRNIDSLIIKSDIKDILSDNLNLEYRNINSLHEGIKYADVVQDYVSRDLMIKILIDEEKHIHFLKTELALIDQIGIHNYIQSQLRK